MTSGNSSSMANCSSSSITPIPRTKNRFSSNHKTLKTPNSLGPGSSTATTAMISSSHFNYVFLEEWWLIRDPNNALAVQGFSHSEIRGVREFSSAAIKTRHDINTLEAADGITISISKLINRHRTLRNGFSSEVCNRFLLGFPYNWEELTAPCFGEKTGDGCAPNTDSACGQYSLDEMPVTRIRDIIMTTLDDSGNSALTKSIFDDFKKKKSIFDAILGKLKTDFSPDPIPSVHEEAKVYNNSNDETTPSIRKKGKVMKKSKGTVADAVAECNGGPMTRRRSARLNGFSTSGSSHFGISLMDSAKHRVTNSNDVNNQEGIISS